MSRRSVLALLKAQIQELMGTLSIEEILQNGSLIKKIEIVVSLLPEQN